MQRLHSSGQSLIELLVSIAVGALFVAAAVAIIAPSLRENKQAANVQAGAMLGGELLQNVRVWSEHDWHDLLSLATGSINTYYLNTSVSPFEVITPASGTYPNGYAYRRTITLTGSEISQVNGTDLVGFPVLVENTLTDLEASSSGGFIQSPAGSDIEFHGPGDASGTGPPLYAEQEYYSSSTGEFTYWVQVPKLSKDTDTEIYMFYDKPNVASGPGYFPRLVWDNNFQGVYHFASIGATTPDSTANGNTGTAYNGVSTVSGRIYEAASFNAGSSQYISMPIDFGSANQRTVEFWLNQSSYIINAVAAGFTPSGNTTVGGFDIIPENSSGKLEVWATGDAATNDNVYTRFATGWHDIVFTEDLTVPQNQINLYVDGSLYTAGLIRNKNGDNTSAFGSNAFYMMTKSASNFDTGIEDELRVSNTLRSPDWINTTYQNESGPGSFCSIGLATLPSRSANETEYVTLGNTTFGRYFYVDDVYRSPTGTIVTDPTLGTIDPSTKKITVVYSWPGNRKSISAYLTRHGENVFYQDDWSGGPDYLGAPVTSTVNHFVDEAGVSYASTTGALSVASGSTQGTLDSATFDTGTGVWGAALNTITWNGTLPGNAIIGFQIGTSSSPTGPWAYYGPNGDSNKYYAYDQPPGMPYALPFGLTGRYFRYRVFLESSGSDLPTVNSISINWSP